MTLIHTTRPKAVRVTPQGVKAFNRRWQGDGRLDQARAYDFTFDSGGNVLRADGVDPQEVEPMVMAMAADCSAWLLRGTQPAWTTNLTRARRGKA